MTTGIYLAFDNAKMASEYYIENFNGTFESHMPFPAEMAEQINLKYDNLDDTTFHAKLTVLGMEFNVSDRFESSSFSDSVHFLIQYGSDEYDEFVKTVDLVKKADSISISHEDTDKDSDHTMIHFKDKFDLVWAVMYIK